MQHSIRVVESTCLLCNSSQSTEYASGTDVEYADTVRDRFTFVKCSQCGLVYMNPRPHESELPSLYPKTYHSYHLSAEKGSSPATRLRQWVYSFRLRKGLQGLRHPIQLLDVGCGDGWMLDCFRRIPTPSIQTYGVEINPSVCKVAEAKGHHIFCGRFEEINFGDQRFDVINISHVIEHVANPSSMLAKARSILKPNGRIIVETPNLRSLDAWLFRKNTWGAYHFPRHWYLFDESKLASLAEREALKVQKVIYNACPVHWHWSFYRFTLLNPRLKFLSAFFSPRIIFGRGPITIAYLATFTLIDVLLKALRAPTSNMMAILSPSDQTL